MELIDLNELRKWKHKRIQSGECSYDDMQALSAFIEGVGKMQMIICKECKHWSNGDDVHGICHRCPNTRQMRYDDFCSYGERASYRQVTGKLAEQTEPKTDCETCKWDDKDNGCPWASMGRCEYEPKGETNEDRR